ncbi:MAG: ABC transporter ATP-binding protein [Anaerolineae bacterium]
MAEPALVQAKGLSKHYVVQRPFSRTRYVVKAVDGVDLCISKGEMFGLVGESGCGKSTIARLLLGLVPSTTGCVLFGGQDVTALQGHALLALRRKMQIVFQDPYSSLNPSFDVRTTLWEGLSKVPGLSRQEAEARLLSLLDTVGLDRQYLHAYPHQLSGGQRQRVGIARALSVQPEFLVADEPTSALDVSVQAQILNLFVDLRQRQGLTMLFISHDVSIVRYLCDRVAVMYLGKIVEQGPTEAVLDAPLHPYTSGLLSSLPRMEHRGVRERRLLPGELPSPLAAPAGCGFHPRCAQARDVCMRQEPPLFSQGPQRSVACFKYEC